MNHASSFSATLWALCLASTTAAAAEPAAGAVAQLRLRCAVFYTPQRSQWERNVVIEHDGRGVRRLHIDGQQPYTYNFSGGVLYTALDNEQIRIALAEGQWRSDFRGHAQGEGRCAALP